MNSTNDIAAERSTGARGAAVRLSPDAVAVAAELTEKAGPRFALEVARAVIAAEGER